ncbi:MAG: bifunctional transaldolase/phosoglucose isomerase, partial [Vicinamibacterales bacterium]
MNPLQQLLQYGQSHWLDNLTRGMIRSGELARRVAADGLRGMTSNPAIFHNAISKGEGYDEQIETLVRQGLPVAAIYERLVVSDVQEACDVLRPVFEASAGLDGYVSLEVSPYLAHDAEGSLNEARKLNSLVARPNVFIKIPGTRACVAAIEQALFEGIHINITLLFSIASYEAVAEAYLTALERRAAAGRPVDDVASVASFFLSRIDVLVDQLLGHRIRPGASMGSDPRPEHLFGRAAIANAKLAYQKLTRIMESDRWKALEARGARIQRLLWASTSTKDPLYGDIRYIEPLIGPHTVNTMPAETSRAFAEHGAVAATVASGVDEARQVMEHLASLGIDIDRVTSQLENEAVQKFIDPFDALMAIIAERRGDILEKGIPRQSIEAGSLAGVIKAGLDSLDARQVGRRLFAKDPSLWSLDAAMHQSIHSRLGWLDSAETFRQRVGDIMAFANEVRDEGLSHVVLLGMGGSSLSAEVCRDMFGSTSDWPDLLVLSSTDPAAVRDVERRIDPGNTLFIVASKSGTTTETMSFYRYFWQKTHEARDGAPGDRFVAITDPGTTLATEARTHGFRRCFENPEDIGGRYSALSYFGLVPMALLGLDLAGLLNRALLMQRSCGSFIPAGSNPGLHLGALLGLAGRAGRNKVTFVPSRSLAAFGAWAEQLLAESTGKAGRGLIPVDAEALGPSDAYGNDRLFVGIRESEQDDGEAAGFLEARAAEGHPVVRIALSDPLDIGAEFLRWEIATATAGSILRVNPFDEPNVAESKRNTRELLAEWQQSGSFSEVRVAGGDEWMTLYSDPSQPWLSVPGASSQSVLQQFLDTATPGDYLALLPYVQRTPACHESLVSLRGWCRDHLR